MERKLFSLKPGHSTILTSCRILWVYIPQLVATAFVIYIIILQPSVFLAMDLGINVDQRQLMRPPAPLPLPAPPAIKNSKQLAHSIGATICRKATYFMQDTVWLYLIWDVVWEIAPLFSEPVKNLTINSSITNITSIF